MNNAWSDWTPSWTRTLLSFARTTTINLSSGLKIWVRIKSSTTRECTTASCFRASQREEGIVRTSETTQRDGPGKTYGIATLRTRSTSPRKNAMLCSRTLTINKGSYNAMELKGSREVRSSVTSSILEKTDLRDSIGSLAMTQIKFTIKSHAIWKMKFTTGMMWSFKTATSSQAIRSTETFATHSSQSVISKIDTDAIRKLDSQGYSIGSFVNWSTMMITKIRPQYVSIISIIWLTKEPVRSHPVTVVYSQKRLFTYQEEWTTACLNQTTCGRINSMTSIDASWMRHSMIRPREIHSTTLLLTVATANRSILIFKT